MKEFGIYCLGEVALINANNVTKLGESSHLCFPFAFWQKQGYKHSEGAACWAGGVSCLCLERGDSNCVSLVPGIPRGPPQPGVTKHSGTEHSNKLYIYASKNRGSLWLKLVNTVAMTSFLKELKKNGNAEERRPLQFSVLVVFILCTCHICQSV